MQLEATGERFVAEGTTVQMQLAYEHLHRYLFARELCRGKVVLDIASGEGYGSNLLAQSARKVIGVDISTDAVRHAKRRYRRDNLQFLSGDCSRIPLKSGSVDVVVSFETIEHISAQEKFLSQVLRVLKARGLLIISSPDKHESTDRTGHLNPHHVAELYREDFLGLLKAKFRNVRSFQQRLIAGSYLAAEDHSVGKVVYGTHRGDLRGGTFNEGVHEGMYVVAVCSTGTIPTRITAGVFENKIESARIWDWYERGAQFREESNDLRRKLVEAQEGAVLAQRQIEGARHETELGLARAQELDKEVVARGEWGRRLDGEIEALQKIVADQRAQIEENQIRNAAAESESARLIAELSGREADFAREAAERGEAAVRLRAELDEAGQAIAAHRSRIEQLELEGTAAEAEGARRVTFLESQAAERGEAAGRLQAELDEAGQAIAAHRSRIEQLELERTAAAAEGARRVTFLESQAAERGEAAGRLKAELDDAGQAIAAHRSRIEQLEFDGTAAATEAARRIHILEKQAAEHQSATDRQQTALEELTAHSAREVAESSELAERQNVEISEQQAVIAALNARIVQLEEDKSAISREAADSAALFESDKAESQAALAHKIAEMEAWRSELCLEIVTRVETEVGLRAEVRDLRADIAEHLALIEQMHAEKIAVDGQMRLVADSETSVRVEMDRLAQELNDRQQLINSIESRAAEVEVDLTREKSERASDVRELRTAIAENFVLVEQLRGERLAADDRLQLAADTENSLRSDIDRLVVALNDQRQVFESMESLAAGFEAELVREKGDRAFEIQRFLSDINSGEAQILKAQEGFSELLSEAESTLKWASFLDKEMADVRASLAEREKHVRSLTDKVNELFRYSRTLEDELGKKDAELTRISSKAGSAQA